MAFLYILSHFALFYNVLTCFVELLIFQNKFVTIILVMKVRVDFMLNELLKKVEFVGLWVDTVSLKELDKKSIYRL